MPWKQLIDFAIRLLNLAIEPARPAVRPEHLELTEAEKERLRRGSR